MVIEILVFGAAFMGSLVGTLFNECVREQQEIEHMKLQIKNKYKNG
jgi:hypothetical protein